MSGHSKWSTIKRQKGAVDIKRGLTFTKIANLITVAVKLGGSGDSESNPRLKSALETARGVNMPKENILRAIDRGLGKGGAGGALEEVTYEGFGPGKVAFYIECLTDNRLRTNQEIKSIFEHNGGRLGGMGSTGYCFKKIGEIRVQGKGGSAEEEMLELIDLGVEDVEEFTENIQAYLVYTEATKITEMSNKITQAGYRVESQELAMKPTMLQEVTDKEIAQKVIEFIEKLEEQEDIQKVYDNFDIPDNLL